MRSDPHPDDSIVSSQSLAVLAPQSNLAARQAFRGDNLAACLGIWISTAFLFGIDAFVVNKIFGVVVILYAAVNLTRVEWTIPREKEKQ